MSFNGSGTYSLPGSQLQNGDTVSATENNQFRNDVATAFNVTVCRDGQAAMTGNLPMGGNKLTNLAAGTTAGDSVRYQQVTSAVAITGGTISGTTMSNNTISSLAVDLAIADGGTGASTAANARTNLGLGSLATLSTVTTAYITDANVTTAKIADLNVTTGKLANSAVTTAKIADDNVTPAKLSQPFTFGTAISLTTTAPSFTGIPSWVTKIDIPISFVTASGGGNIVKLQLGTGAGPTYVTSGYTNASADGFYVAIAVTPPDSYSGILSLVKLNPTSNAWAFSSNVYGTASTSVLSSAGVVILTNALTALRIICSTTGAPSVSFSTGTMNILYQ